MAISAETLKCVVFFGRKPRGREPAEVVYGGTGFLATYVDEGFTFRYVVTCRHVAERLQNEFVLRVNNVAGGVDEVAIEEDAGWQYHPDESVDVAATALSLNALHYDHLALPLWKVSRRENIAAGQRTHIVGMFRLHYGKQRNVPIVHTGHIAALADPLEKIAITNRATGTTILSEAHLVEAQTLEGLSGSPVFVQEYVSFGGKVDGGQIKIGAFGEVRILGVYQGAWDGQPGVILEADRNLSGNHRVPVGMGIVVPIERVVELVEQNEVLKGWREKSKAREKATVSSPRNSEP